MPRPINAPRPMAGSVPEDTERLNALAAALGQLVELTAERLSEILTGMLENGKRKVIADLSEDPAAVCLAMLTAALTLEAERTGPQRGRLTFYLPSDSGRDARKVKAMVEIYRKIGES